MPGSNTHKIFIADHFYHIYNRGWNLSEIFIEPSDYGYFEGLLKRHISVSPVEDGRGREYTHMRESIELNAYSLIFPEPGPGSP